MRISQLIKSICSVKNAFVLFDLHIEFSVRRHKRACGCVSVYQPIKQKIVMNDN